jgi:hypothetical protein
MTSKKAHKYFFQPTKLSWIFLISLKGSLLNFRNLQKLKEIKENVENEIKKKLRCR